MIVIKFRQYLLHYGLSKENRLGVDTKLVTVLLNGSHLTVIQVDDLPVLPHKSLLLLLYVFRINTRPAYFFLPCHYC